MNRTTLALTVLAASSALTLSACGTDPYVETLTAADEAPAVEETTEAPPEEETEPADASLTDTGSPLLAFGDSATYDDGLEVSVDVTAETTLSDVGSTDSCTVGDPVTVVELTVTNGTNARINPWEDFMGSLNAEYVDSTGYAVMAQDVFDAADYNGGYDLSGGQNFATLRPGQTGSDLYGFCTVDMEDGSLYLSIDPTTYEEPGYKALAEWTEDGQW